MKRTKRTCLTRILVLVLVVAMLTPTTLAAGSGFGLSSWFQGIWDRFVGWFQPAEPEVPTEPEVPAGELTVVESPDTVDNGEALRASTYALGNAAEPLANETVKYFPVTMFDYDTDAINNVTHGLEYEANPDLTEWSGLYFNDGTPQPTRYTYSQNSGYVPSATLSYDNQRSFSQYENSGYYYPGAAGYYEVTDISCERSWHGFPFWYYTYEWRITCGSQGFTSNNETITLYRPGAATTDALPFADYNFWTGHIQGSNKHGNRVYSGLVENQLVNGNIKFTVTEPGIFTTGEGSQVEGKTVYTGVGLPFRYADGTYTFDSDEFGAYAENGQMTENENLNLSNSTQYIYEMKENGSKQRVEYADGSKNAWLPFDGRIDVQNTAANYHFGMKAVIPFTMTEDGKLLGENGEDIIFTFAGDDDVWIFIDNTLVLDIGGIHNRLGGELNFAENTWKLTKPESNTDKNELADVKNGDLTGKLFTDDEGVGLLNQTRASFAARDDHQLTIFYLERGEGSSNCRISFNLPVKDSVSVTKQVSTTDSAGMPLDDEALQAAQNRDFTFTLYKDRVPVANRNYSLLDETGAYLGTRSTDRSGKFTLRDGQTAKFVGEISSTEPGSSYYVVENVPAGWETPAFEKNAVGANNPTYTAPNGGNSGTVTMVGGTESEDSITFVCTNTFTHVDGTSLTPGNDTIVIDYGLPVKVDVLANDIVTGGTKSLESVTGAKYGTAEIRDNKIIYTLNQPLSDIETLTYTVKATASNGVEADNKEATATLFIIPATVMYYEENFGGMVTYSDGWKSEGEPDGDFQEPGVVGTNSYSPYGSDVAYLDDTGDSNGTSMYVDTSKSGSNSFSYTFTGTGTSFFARTTNNTGYLEVKVYRGDKLEGTPVITWHRNTQYINDENKTLFNIPVFTWDAVDADLGYGTYTVRVSVAGNTAGRFGTEFWLDGIRVFNPLDPDKLPDEAETAYSRDGEANMNVATLRDKLLANATSIDQETGEVKWDGENFVLFTDTDGSITTAEAYQSIGPKEEVYLARGQSVTFSLRNWNANDNHVWLGMKAPMGGGTVTVDGEEISISNTTDCFYELEGKRISYEEDGTQVVTFTITCTGDTVISLTNVKVSGSAEFTVIDGEDFSGEAEP